MITRLKVFLVIAIALNLLTLKGYAMDAPEDKVPLAFKRIQVIDLIRNGNFKKEDFDNLPSQPESNAYPPRKDHTNLIRCSRELADLIESGNAKGDSASNKNYLNFFQMMSAEMANISENKKAFLKTVIEDIGRRLCY